MPIPPPCLFTASLSDNSKLDKQLAMSVDATKPPNSNSDDVFIVLASLPH